MIDAASFLISSWIIGSTRTPSGLLPRTSASRRLLRCYMRNRTTLWWYWEYRSPSSLTNVPFWRPQYSTVNILSPCCSLWTTGEESRSDHLFATPQERAIIITATSQARHKYLNTRRPQAAGEDRPERRVGGTGMLASFPKALRHSVRDALAREGRWGGHRPSVVASSSFFLHPPRNAVKCTFLYLLFMVTLPATLISVNQFITATRANRRNLIGNENRVFTYIMIWVHLSSLYD